MVARLAPLAMLALFLAAGCAEPAPASETPGLVVDASRPDTSFGEVLTGPAVGPDLDATTAAPPRLVEGEWWRIEFGSEFYAQTSEVVRVVANATEDGYIFGMPHAGWFKEAISYHAPAFGDVALDLSYATHNERFQPVRFPLVAGDTWETVFATTPLIATVESADDVTATIRFDTPTNPNPSPQQTAMGAVMDVLMPSGDGPFMRLTYDARQHEVVEMTSFIGSWKVVAHGYDFEGWVTVPRGEHTAIDYGTFWALDGGAPVTSQQVEVSGGFNRLTMMHVIIPLAPGQFRITHTPPQGEPFVTELMGSDFHVAFYEVSDPDGTWLLQDEAIGAGATYSMGIAYHQYDIHLPDQQRRTDHSHAVVR